MKKIQVFITGLGPGGAERQLTGLATMLKKRGYIVQVCWYTNVNFYESILVDAGVECKRLYTSNHLKKIFNIKNAIKDFKPDYVISFLDGPNTICPYLKLVTFGKYKLFVSERNTTQKLDWRSKIRFAGYRFADKIIPNSGSQSRFIALNYPKYEDEIVTITNFTDLQVFKPVEKTSSEIIRGMVAARVTDAKNVIRFIKSVALAISKGANIDITWFGDAFYPEYEKLCQKTILEMGISNHFRLLPATKNIIDEYAKCDVVLLPSHFEGCPNVICEAISCGLPVLCSNVCDNSTLVQNGINGYLFNQLSENDIADKILKFCGLPIEQRKIMGVESRKMAESLLSKDVFLNKYIQLFK